MHKQYHKGNTVLQRRRHRDRKSFGYIRFYSWAELHAMEKTDPRLKGGPGWHIFKNQYGAGFSRDVPAGIIYTMVDVARQAMLAGRRIEKKARTKLYRNARRRQAYHLKKTGELLPLFTGGSTKPGSSRKNLQALAGVLGDIRKGISARNGIETVPGE